MEQRISVLTIGANDLVALREFYEDILEWKPVAQNNDIVFYQMNGFLLSLSGKQNLEQFIGTTMGNRGPITIGYNVDSEDEVLKIYEKLVSKGVKTFQPPKAPPFGGLFFYFEDVEGNILEVACNRYVTMSADHNVTGHLPIDDL